CRGSIAWRESHGRHQRGDAHSFFTGSIPGHRPRDAPGSAERGGDRAISSETARRHGGPGDDRHSDAGDLVAMSRKAVFLDKDGTLIENHPFDRSPEHIEWLHGTIEGLRLLHHAGYALIVVSNQGGVAQGRF